MLSWAHHLCHTDTNVCLLQPLAGAKLLPVRGKLSAQMCQGTPKGACRTILIAASENLPLSTNMHTITRFNEEVIVTTHFDLLNVTVPTVYSYKDTSVIY
jgi:hypothetical protein